MLPCLGPPSSAAKANSCSCRRSSQGYSMHNTTGSNTLTSPTVNLSDEWLAIHSLSYGEIWSKIHHFEQNTESGQVEIYEDPGLLGQILQPSRDLVKDVVSHIRPNALINPLSSYFNHSEKTSHLCLLLYQSVSRARLLYAPLQDLLDNLPTDVDSGSNSINQSQCDWAFDVFLQFDSADNPFLSPDSRNFDEIRRSFSELRTELDQHLRKTRPKAHFLRHATLVPFCPACVPSKISKQELNHLSDATAKGAYVLRNDLDTIDRLVARLYTAVDGDKLLIRLGLERGRDRHPIEEIVRESTTRPSPPDCIFVQDK